MGRFFTPACLLGLLSACTAQAPNTSPPLPLRAQATIGVASERQQTELRYGRYTLVSTTPTTEQKDLLAQIIEVTIPSNLSPSVQDALLHVLQRSGYSLCPATASVQVLFTRPLPAAHYRLGPITLRNALQVLAGPAWQLTVDEVSRSVCFIQQKNDIPTPPLTPVLSSSPEVRP
ncbi:PilL N-terminal domain-containing protein [Pseudomonas sp. H11T01]|uniref:PFGI-1 class ICE element type IV pilus protein PilL2 n=1 Tax=Pseudomonas sp. H11T01 TaxID=3402749 RepID=UPI003AC7CF75